jgi:ribosomal protein L11 methyltransferase
MLYKQKLWIMTAIVVPELAEPLADQLQDQAAAVTIMVPPRQTTATVEAIFEVPPDMPSLTAQAAVIASLKNLPSPVLVCHKAPPLDWLKKVAEDFPPFRVARWTIHGALHRQSVKDRRQALQIDATNAFGTGEHPTTRGCLMMLGALLRQHRNFKYMLDIGCGSGVLAMAFTKATHGKAIAVDLDPVSVAISRHNRNINGLQGHIQVGISRGYAAAQVRTYAPYDLIMSNIFARPLATMAKDLRRHLRPNGIAILAGLLNTQANLVINAHRAQGLHLIHRVRIGEWTILAMKRRHKA